MEQPSGTDSNSDLGRRADVVALVPAASGAEATVRRRALRVALVGNFAPRKCGIATFTTDVFEQLRAFHPEIRIDVYALQDADDVVEHAGIHAEIDRDDPLAFERAARQMNEDAVDAVWVQHEFGIFGGECGAHVMHLVDRIAAPLVVTMHTVLANPDHQQEAIMRRLLSRASRLMVMCKAGRQLLLDRYQAAAERVEVIEHGAPDRELRLSSAKPAGSPMTLMTFGLLGPGKGLETAIAALPEIIARHPETKYRIVGVEHPNEARRNGASYRRKLETLATELGVADHIEWVARFVEMDELVDMLEACDIYLTPYPGLQQSTSGTLSYAVSLGRAVVSTRYIHARELLEDTGGVLVDVGDPAAIAREVNRLLDDPRRLEALQLRTYRRGRRTTWKHFAANTKALLDRAVTAGAPVRTANMLATPGLAAFDLMCDGTGMLQHGRFAVPDRDHGYCLDDNARALMLVHRIEWSSAADEYRRAGVFASFVQHSWNADRGLFRNFMHFDRTWCEDVGSEDSNGRGLWALGDTVAHARHAALRTWAIACFDRFAHIALDFGSPRAIAFAALGAVSVLERKPDHALAHRIIEATGAVLERLLGGARRPDWTWFETVLGYDNPRLSEALIACGRVTGNRVWVDAGLESLRWILDHQTGANGFFRPVGSDTFGHQRDILPFDQQPLEAWAAIDACATAHACRPTETAWLDHASRAYRWFFGDNDRGAVLVDLQIGSCLDGVTPHGPNQNVGAESLLAFQLSYYRYMRLLGRAGPDWRRDAAGQHPQRI